MNTQENPVEGRVWLEKWDQPAIEYRWQEEGDHQVRPSRNSWDRPSASEVQASTYLIRSIQVAGVAKLVDGVAVRPKEQHGIPWWSKAS